MSFIDGQNVVYNGQIISVKTSGKYKITKVTDTYWKDDETEEEHVNMTCGRC